MHNGKFKVIILTETWLSDMMNDGILDPKALYNIYRKNRKDQHGGLVNLSTAPNSNRSARLSGKGRSLVFIRTSTNRPTRLVSQHPQVNTSDTNTVYHTTHQHLVPLNPNASSYPPPLIVMTYNLSLYYPRISPSLLLGDSSLPLPLHLPVLPPSQSGSAETSEGRPS